MMTLNKQLFVVSLLLLSIPWSGCQYLQDIDASLRSGQERTLQASTQVIAKALAQNPGSLSLEAANKFERIEGTTEDNPAINNTLSSLAPDFYCHPNEYLIEADGYADNWPDIPWTLWPDSNDTLIRYRCMVYQNQLMLFFEINNSEMIFNNPTRSLASNGDRLILVTGNNKEYIFAAQAPGDITARYFNPFPNTYRESSIKAALIDEPNSYQLEISMPLALVNGRLSFYSIDDSANGSTRLGPYRDNAPVPPLIYQSNAIKAVVNTYTLPGQRLRLVNPQGWLIASTGTLETRSQSNSHWLLQKLYRKLLAERHQQQTTYQDHVNYSARQEFKKALTGQSSTMWYNDPLRTNQHFLTNAEPIFINGAIAAILIAEQSSEQTATLTDQAFSRLFSFSIIIMGSATLSLLAYASWLSWRIRQLSKATQNALDDRGKLSSQYPHSNANDEIGVLTRNYSELMKRLGEYTDYLQTLSRKLSHELRTPLAIIHSSLDNLESQPLNTPSRTYQQRAKEGAQRLGTILTAMSEANRVEESIKHSEPEPTDIILLLTDLSAAYSDLYPHHHISFENSDNTASLNMDIVPDLIVQMLDKLIENATSYCPPNGDISIRTSQSKNTLQLAVSNDGPLLPETMKNQLFDNMVSLRETNDSQSTHLGLGLYIVSLIVNFHGGTINATNRDDHSGVVFTMLLPIH
ncbi:ATP-binding protein [Oceanicoccus sp. KOV_DT_Chl]|uniref:ATP-binding protein n=1 Tax=Oceanicoccus sp. KOV_DT_Chl TaxID=1904639 RepID=UPI000C798E0D|nr:ATP-binding protein [Oceanicoccus sp. KOV_DT_Chl]